MYIAMVTVFHSFHQWSTKFWYEKIAPVEFTVCSKIYIMVMKKSKKDCFNMVEIIVVKMIIGWLAMEQLWIHMFQIPNLVIKTPLKNQYQPDKELIETALNGYKHKLNGYYDFPSKW